MPVDYIVLAIPVFFVLIGLLAAATPLVLPGGPAVATAAAAAAALSWLLRYRRAFPFHRDPKKVPTAAVRAS
jgi:hypothetical protein